MVGVVIAALVVWLVFRAFRRTGRIARSAPLGHEVEKSANSLLARAQVASTPNEAVLLYVRAAIARLHESGRIVVAPSTTASEAAQLATAVAPGDFLAAAALFNAVAYGHHTATLADVEAMRSLAVATFTNSRQEVTS
ncbi:hypothetical protein J2S49_001432 [Arcanobacterium wilhelmae]|uniref:Protein-glutamine gamma-glutamyltransferase-like C-terminal domain-containing protein n=1 Tax=Arcanobacterium wilhelmae TaxID=1803177 RepID=A0ABT9NCA8_9ACTO|nr:DUF4129 domain-containing protein [Arcanobacterium wilhelmae]MDP9801356.1 hypothetical protein [Arcanobacterium wilhelmae]